MDTLTEIVVLGTVLHVAVLAVMIWIRVRRTEGDGGADEGAKGTPCAVCGKPAVDWRYDGLDPDEQVDPSSGRAWSYDMSHYRPLCADHADQNSAGVGAGPMTGEPVVDGELRAG